MGLEIRYSSRNQLIFVLLQPLACISSYLTALYIILRICPPDIYWKNNKHIHIYVYRLCCSKRKCALALSRSELRAIYNLNTIIVKLKVSRYKTIISLSFVIINCPTLSLKIIVFKLHIYIYLYITADFTFTGCYTDVV